jgi:hypothetical protein
MRSFARTPRLALLAGALLLAGSCGDNLGPEETMVLNGTSALDGFVYIGADTLAHTNGGGPAIGDLDGTIADLHVRQFFSFDLTALPDNAEVQIAELRLNQAAATATSYTELGNVLVDHMDYGASLDTLDYNRTALTAAYGTLSTTVTLGVKALTVTTAVQADRNAGRTRSQYRIRFETSGNNDGTSDYAQFTDGEGSTPAPDSLPRLVIVYRRPQ